MTEEHFHHYTNTPFSVICSSIENEPGTWNSTKVSIYYNKDRLIGEYIRNFNSFGAMTFYPFMVDDQWYALYSPHYTATRVLRLYDDRIEDWCGEDPDGAGFCPVEFYVPMYVENIFEVKDKDGKKEHHSTYTFDCDVTEEEFKHEINKESFIKLQYCNFGFLCGCHWGDDSSWKIRYIDLTKIPNKELIIEEKFGYWEMPGSLTLRQCIKMYSWEPDDNWIELTGCQNINLKTNERC